MPEGMGRAGLETGLRKIYTAPRIGGPQAGASDDHKAAESVGRGQVHSGPVFTPQFGYRPC